jgi:carbon storage regulator CsrA
MLILSRKAGERISIGEEIQLTVLGIRKGRVSSVFWARQKSQFIEMKLYDALGQNRQSPQQSMRSSP